MCYYFAVPLIIYFKIFRVTESRKLKQAELKEIKLKVDSREKDDEQIAADLIAGETMIEKLEDRLLSVNMAYNEAKSLQEEYSKLINFMLSYPPMTEKHVASLEQELALARQQLLDLQKVLYSYSSSKYNV